MQAGIPVMQLKTMQLNSGFAAEEADPPKLIHQFYGPAETISADTSFVILSFNL